MKPITLAIASLALVVLSGAAAAQVDPALMVSRVDSIPAFGSGVFTYPLYTVPTGHRFVLTTVLVSDVTTYTQIFKILDNSVERWILAAHARSSAANQTTHELDVQPGLVFDAGHVVQFRAPVVSGISGYYKVCWAGYLVPLGTASVPTAAAELLGFQLAPNPSRQVVTLRFVLSRPADVALGVFDVQGRLVRSLRRGRLQAGQHAEPWDGRTDAGAQAAAGVYFACLQSSAANSVKRLVRIR